MEPPRYHHLSLLLFSCTAAIGATAGMAQERLGSVTLEAVHGLSTETTGPLRSIFRSLLSGAAPRERVRAISNARLCALLRLHLHPIHVVVCDDPIVEILSWGGLRA